MKRVPIHINALKFTNESHFFVPYEIENINSKISIYCAIWNSISP